MLFKKLAFKKVPRDLIFQSSERSLDLELEESKTPTQHPPDLQVVGILVIKTQFFYCVDCAKFAQRNNPELNYEVIFHGDIFPHQQSCHQCNCQAVAGDPQLPEKFWKVIPNDACLSLLLQDVDDLESQIATNPGISPSSDELITLRSIKVPNWPEEDEITITSHIPMQLAAHMQAIPA